ncbi:unnamed protein product [Pipistrellus nathusii]|uniref:Nuclear body protein SP140-like protein n=1 Tax=Pipistrellus nathusii TaxID=59473 RepID=A0ABP0ADL4_PIPNA
MASGGRDLSTRMSAEDENIVNKYTNDIALTCFKKYKVEISGAITTTFPFLELIRDRGFITDEMYEKSQESFKKRFTVHEVIYDVLSELEKKFDMSILQALFSKVIMNKYTDLYRIYKIFNKEIPDIKSFLESDEEENEERPNYHLEQGMPSGQEARNESSQASDIMGTVDIGNNSKSGKAKKRKRTTMHTEETGNFNAEILPVTCGDVMGILIKRKLQRGATVKCIRTEDGKWCTPREFEGEGGYEKASNWKSTVYCRGRSLKWLIESGYLPQPPHDRKRKLEKKCNICGDEGKIFKCSFCLSFFHEDCHIPPVELERKDWLCTFCTIEESPQSQQHASYSEVLLRQMGPEEKSKCVFLLLKLYCHLEKNIFQNIPDEHYVQKASQCLQTLRTLDEIKNKLNGGCFTKVNGLVVDMKKICQDSKHNDSVLTEEEFEKIFKEVFSIQ